MFHQERIIYHTKEDGGVFEIPTFRRTSPEQALCSTWKRLRFLSADELKQLTSVRGLQQLVRIDTMCPI